MPLKVLHLPLMFLGRGAGGEGAEIAALAGAGILLPRVKSILAGSEFANHNDLQTNSEAVGLRLLHLLPNRSRHGAAAGHDVVELNKVQRLVAVGKGLLGIGVDLQDQAIGPRGDGGDGHVRN